jgi:LPS export ABC transporter protein LptC
VTASAASHADDADTRSPLLYPVLGLLALLAGWLAFEGFRDPGDVPSALAEQRPRYHIEVADWTRYDEAGARVFVVGASSIDYFDDASMQLADIVLDTHAGDGQWRLDASRGSVPPGEKRLRLEPQVDVRGRTRKDVPVQIRTPTLWVDWAERTLSTEDAVDARTGASTLQAVGMRADWNGQHVEFLSDVKVRHVAGG